MAFADVQSNRTIVEGYGPVELTLAGACLTGDPIGYSSGWKQADANATVQPALVAGQSGAIGDKIRAFACAVVRGSFGATPGAVIYCSDTAGQYSESAGTTTYTVGTVMDANNLWVAPGAGGAIDTSDIVDGAITNAKVNSAAAIAFSKLAALTSAYILVGNSSNVPTAVAVTGDIGITNAGLTSISTGVIIDADVKSDAAIALTKLASQPVRSAAVVVASNDASVLEKAQADYVCDGTDDYVQIQAAIDAVEAIGSGVVKLVGGTFALGATGVEMYQTSDIIFDFRGAKITYSGTSSAINLTEDRTATQIWRCQILGGKVTAIGSAISSGTAIGITARQIQNSIIDVQINEFRAGVGFKLLSGAASGDFCENNRISVYSYNNHTGIYFTGSGGTAYNVVENFEFDNYNSTTPIGFLADDVIGSDQLCIKRYTLWNHANGTIGLDLTRVPQFHIETLQTEGSSTGNTTIKTRTLSIGHISELISSAPGRTFDLYETGTYASKVALDHFYINTSNPYLNTVNLNVSGRDVAFNPSITNNINGYSAFAAVIAYESSGGYEDAGCLSLINNTGNTWSWFYIRSNISDDYHKVEPGSTIWVTMMVKASINSTLFKGAIKYYNASLVEIEDQYSSIQYINTAEGWSKLAWRFTVPEDAVYAAVGCLTQCANNTDKTYFDNCHVYIGGTNNLLPRETKTATGTLTAPVSTVTAVTGTFTESPATLKPGANTLHCTVNGTANVVVPTGCKAVVASVDGGATVTDSPKTCTAGTTLITVAAGGTNEFTVALTAIAFAWHNPEVRDIFIKRVVVDITTAGGTATSVIDVGIADDTYGTNRGTEFFDDIDANGVATSDSIATATIGKQTVWVRCQDADSATDGWIVGQFATEIAANLVGKYYIEYCAI